MTAGGLRSDRRHSSLRRGHAITDHDIVFRANQPRHAGAGWFGHPRPQVWHETLPGQQMTSPVAGPIEARFPPVATSPALARDFVERYLHQQDLPYLVDASCLVVSELVTNSVVHARTPIRVSIEEMPFCVKLTVYDESVDPPVLSPADRVGTDDEGGRGLWIVDTFCEDWGTDVAGDEGKGIWALFAVRPKSSWVENGPPGPRSVT